MTTYRDRFMSTLRNMFLSLSVMVEENLQLATSSVLQSKPENIQLVTEKDRKIDEMEITVEEECLKTIAMYQPVANELRFIVSILKVNNDLERIGDLAVNIVRKSKVLPANTEFEDFSLPQMVEKTLEMFHLSLDAFIKMDTDLATRVCQMDDEVDKLKFEIKQLAVRRMTEHPDQIETYLGLMLTARDLERVADLSTNIAEDVIYTVEGKIIRHLFKAKKVS